MSTFATTVFSALSQLHKTDLLKDAQHIFRDDKIELKEYIIKSDTNQLPKFYFADLPLSELLSDPERWDSFARLFEKIFLYVTEDLPETNQVQFLVTSLVKGTPVNIFFSITDIKEISLQMVPLRNTLLVSSPIKEDYVKKGNIFIFGYDKDLKVWQINEL